jgi:hypothetical protein
MPRILWSGVLVLSLLVGQVAITGRSRADTLFHWGGDAGRAARPGAYVPYDGAPFSHRYNYPEPSLFLWGSYGRNFYLQEQLDRQERLEKFGTRYGPDHPPLFNRLLDRWRR